MNFWETIAQAWTGHYELEGDASIADCVIGFSFGYRGRASHASPGLSNQDLANIAMKHFADLPKIFQFEIADAYEQAGGKDAAEILRITKSRKPGAYLDTREVAWQAKQLMDEHGWRHPILLAHPYHMPRVYAVCRKLGMQPIVTGNERGAVEFDPQSSQKWTAHLDRWRGYEPQALIYYKLRGWV